MEKRRFSANKIPPALTFLAILTALVLGPASAAAAEVSEREAMFFTLNTVFSVINAMLAIGCALISFRIVKILSDKRKVARLRPATSSRWSSSPSPGS